MPPPRPLVGSAPPHWLDTPIPALLRLLVGSAHLAPRIGSKHYRPALHEGRPAPTLPPGVVPSPPHSSLGPAPPRPFPHFLLDTPHPSDLATPLSFPSRGLALKLLGWPRPSKLAQPHKVGPAHSRLAPPPRCMTRPSELPRPRDLASLGCTQGGGRGSSTPARGSSSAPPVKLRRRGTERCECGRPEGRRDPRPEIIRTLSRCCAAVRSGGEWNARAHPWGSPLGFLGAGLLGPDAPRPPAHPAAPAGDPGPQGRRDRRRERVPLGSAGAALGAQFGDLGLISPGTDLGGRRGCDHFRACCHTWPLPRPGFPSQS